MYTLLPEYTINGSRMDLIPLTLSNLADVERVISDPLVTRGLLGDISTAERLSESALVWITDLDYWEEHRYGMWAVLDRGSISGVPGRFLGAAGADDPPPGGMGPEVFYFFSKEAWGQGVGLECMNLIKDYMFDKVKVNALEALIFAEINPSSVRLAQSLEMEMVDRINVVGHHLDPQQAMETVDFDLWCIRESAGDEQKQKQNILAYSCFRIGQFVAEGVTEKMEILGEIVSAALSAGIDDPGNGKNLGEYIESRVNQGMHFPGFVRYRCTRSNSNLSYS